MSAHLIHGDSFLVPQRLTGLLTEIGAGEVLEANMHRLVGSQVKPSELLNVCNALPFMDAYRVVVVDGLLTATEPPTSSDRATRRKPVTESPANSEWRVLADSIPNMPETTVLVFVEGKLAANNRLLRLLRGVCQTEELSAPSGEALARWIKDAAAAKSSTINPSAIRAIIDLVGNDLWTLNQELEKLSLYASGREINETDIQTMVSQVREASIFAAVDAMVDGRPSAALRLLHQLREDGREAPYIIRMVERQLRLLALARDSIDKGIAPNEIGSQLGTSSDFVIRKTLEQARRHSWQDIVQRYNLLLETDLAIKQGQLEPDLALDLLVGEQQPER